MGSFEPPTWAYMIPIVTETGAFPEDDPARAGAIHVYRVRPNQVDAFQAKYSGPGFTFKPIYSLLEFENSSTLPPPVNARRPQKDPKAY